LLTPAYLYNRQQNFFQIKLLGSFGQFTKLILTRNFATTSTSAKDLFKKLNADTEKHTQVLMKELERTQKSAK